MALTIKDLTVDDPVFSHHAEDTGIWTHIAARRLADHIEGRIDLVKNIAADEELYKTILTHNGVERHQVNWWKLQYLVKPDQRLPILIDWSDGHQTLADGNHRFCALYEMGVKRIRMYLVPEKIWREFVVEIPKALEQYVQSEGWMEGDYTHLREKK